MKTFRQIVKGVRGSIAGCVAVPVLAALLITTTVGCTPQQKQTTLQVVTAINAKMPTVIAAADTVAATVAVILPADGVIIGITDVAFDTAAKSIQALTASYIANPNASTLTQIQTAINTLESQVNTATLSVVGIKNQANQTLAVAALKGLLTTLSVVFGMVMPTESATMLDTLRSTDTIHLARMRPYMDEPTLRAVAVDQGVPKLFAGIAVNQAFSAATAAGF